MMFATLQQPLALKDRLQPQEAQVTSILRIEYYPVFSFHVMQSDRFPFV